MRGTHRLGILAASVALLAIGAAMWLAGRRTSGEVQDTSTSDASPASSDAEVLAALGVSSAGEGAPSSSIQLTAAPGEIRGVLLDPQGHPSGGTVSLSGIGDVSRWRRAVSTEADSAGRFRFEPGKLHPPYWVVPRSTERHWGIGMLATVGGEPVVLRLRVRPTVRVTVLDATGAPVAGARVAIYRREIAAPGNPHGMFGPPTDEEVASGATRSPGGSQSATDDRGVAVLAHPGPDVDCTLSASYERMDRDDVRPLFLASWKPADCTVRLPASYVVEGTVRDAAGVPVPDGTVAWRTGDDAPWHETRVLYDGTFRIAGLDGGSITIEPRLEDVVLPEGMGRRPVAAGALDVPLTLDLGSALEVFFVGWPEDGVGAHAYLTKEPAQRGGLSAVGEVAKDGSCRFRGVRPGESYTLFLPSTHATYAALYGGTEEVPRRVAYRSHLTLADSPARVELVEGKSVGGRVVLDALPPDQRESVAMSGVIWIADRGVDLTGWNDGNEFLVQGVPVGEWVVEGVFSWTTGPEESPTTFVTRARCTCTVGGEPGTLRFEAGKPGTPPPRRDR